ncbi:hypothetical protein HS1genome_1905 [Sulfodiicoccus acidiphilus]|uniref:Uncharacterized protein n=1 Tax=Sulfodiicoccus acidiphilus TaxID=1670455 RepID=A0A348B5R4_9CREN|nr:hypothetical protein [Sulfodiicoccus acidiphilus]BBD73516.1 hypothetical protein HS1genome_1905 [Sulfodiicoccus acidiphilus]GGT92590.1 hypothetical protein GCM10007116_07940 [Sulfodiicoccus acidiphilus]
MRESYGQLSVPGGKTVYGQTSPDLDTAELLVTIDDAGEKGFFLALAETGLRRRP